MNLISFYNRHKYCIITLLFILFLALAKMEWVRVEYRNIGTFEKEERDILERRNWLVKKVMVKPEKLIDEMPSAIGEQFQGEWALYSCSMLTEALANIAAIYPETKDDAITQIDSLIRKHWLKRAKNEWIDPKTGLLASFMNEWGEINPTVKGSYSALNCFYLTKVDTCFAREQYEKLKENFRQMSPVNGLKEYVGGLHLLEMDLDAGPILLNLSPTGTAFAIGSATFFNDSIFRSQLFCIPARLPAAQSASAIVVTICLQIWLWLVKQSRLR